MRSFKIFCTVALLFAAVSVQGNLSFLNKLRPSQWLSPSQLENIPGINEISLNKLESMSVEKGAELLERICK